MTTRPRHPVIHEIDTAMYDVRPDRYTTVICETIRHENDVTHRRAM